MHIIRTAFTAALLLALVATPALAKSTARSSGVQGLHLYPRSSSPIVGKLADQERVYLDQCTRKARWCHAIPLDGGPSGWVMGADLIGSPAKVEVTPFEFSFDPMDPLDLFPDRH